MVWIIGNSPTRIFLKDLDDIVYYRQKKQYTDQEYQRSKDLQKEIQLGHIIKLESRPDKCNSFSDISESKITIDLNEIKRVVSEALESHKSGNVKDFMTTMIPILTETVRQEIAKIPVQIVGQTSYTETPSIELPSYVPNVETDDMKSNIKIEGKNVDDSDVSGSLNLLRKLTGNG